MNEQHLRMSDAEREAAASELGEHYAQGRLSAEEHAERLDLVWAARTRGELGPVFADLPGHRPTAYAGPRRGSDRPARGYWSSGPVPFRRGVPTPLLVVLAVLLVVTVVTHLPVIVLGLLVWWFVATRHHRWTRQRRW
ncbi:MAG: DUF1707 SHOCT-like domain-containing protein [Nocardioides sp.]